MLYAIAMGQIKMLVVNNRKLKKQYVIGGNGMLDTILQFLVKTFTSQAAQNLASSAAKEIGKTALDAGKNSCSGSW